MRLYRDLTHARVSTASVVTIGNFDGLHRGHRALLELCRERAGGDAEVAVVTFEPTPREWFDLAGAFPRLVGVRQKLSLLRDTGVDLVWMMRFNGRLAAVSARNFVTEFLVQKLAARCVVVGDDFRFGHGRKGDANLLAAMGATLGFETEAVASINHAGVRISSTAIRERLVAGDLAGAADMLGRPYRMIGRVLRGRRLGTNLGYPTANIRPPGGRSPMTGVFAVRARAGNGAWRAGVASLGTRPAVGGGAPMLEVHLFDYSGDLYGLRLETEFVHKLREEQDFRDLDALVAQMAKDAGQARSLLAPAGTR